MDGFDSHAEEDGESIADQPGNPKTKQGQTLLPTASKGIKLDSMYDIKPIMEIELVKRNMV